MNTLNIDRLELLVQRNKIENNYTKLQALVDNELHNTSRNQKDKGKKISVVSKINN
jgi:hypothetical protein